MCSALGWLTESHHNHSISILGGAPASLYSGNFSQAAWRMRPVSAASSSRLSANSRNDSQRSCRSEPEASWELRAHILLRQRRHFVS